MVLSAGPATRAQAPDGGLFITVTNPLTEFRPIKGKVQRNLERIDRKIRTLVFDFNPDNRANTSDDYGVCRNLAAFILEQRNVTTIAFVHSDVTGHLVLPALACQEIVMSSEARLGDACAAGLASPSLPTSGSSTARSPSVVAGALLSS